MRAAGEGMRTAPSKDLTRSLSERPRRRWWKKAGSATWRTTSRTCRSRSRPAASTDPDAGDTITYAELAERAGNPRAYRAAGSAWAVGTEINLVNRLVQRFPDKHIRLLAPDLCMCATMYRIAPQNLAWALESLLAGRVVNQITVDDETARWARVALDRAGGVAAMANAAWISACKVG